LYAAIYDRRRYLVLGMARHSTAAAALAFLDEMPFVIQCIQTDRGAEFLAEPVQRRLMALGIRFRPVPRRSPQLNGKVDRVQPRVFMGFWATVDPKADGVEDLCAVWVQYYDGDRAHEMLGNVLDGG